MKSARAKTATVKGATRIDALTRMAVDMFLDHGYEAVSLEALIAEVGGSRRNIYRHFGGKEGLFLAAITSACEDQTAPLKSLEIPLSGSLSEALMLFGQSLLDGVLLPRTLALHRLMIAEALRFPQLAQTIWRFGHEQAAEVLADWIAHQQKVGMLRQSLPAPLLARQFVDLVAADVQLCAQIGIPVVPDRHDALKAAIETFLHGQAANASAIDS